MFPFHCSRCSRKSFSAGIPRCLHCPTIEPRNAMDDTLSPREPEAPRESGIASGSKNHLLPNNMQMTEQVHSHDRKRNVSKDQIELDNSPTHKISKKEISAITHQAHPTCSEMRAMDYDIAKEARPTSQIGFDKSRLDGIHNKFPNNKESHPHYQDVEDNSIEQNSASNFDNFQIPLNLNLQKETSNSVAPMREVIPYVDDSLAVPGPSGFQKYKNTSNLWGEELQSISSLELQSAGVIERNRSEKKCNLQQHTDTIHSTEKLRCNICEELIWKEEDHDKEETCHFCEEKFQCKTLLEQHSLHYEDYYFLHCRVCSKTISEHFDPEDKTFYKCCQCSLRNRLKCCIRIHLYTHTGIKLFKCDVCDMRFTLKRGLLNHLPTHIKCEICRERYLRSEKLLSHRSENHQT